MMKSNNNNNIEQPPKLNYYDIKLQITKNTYELARSMSFLLGYDTVDEYVKAALLMNLNMYANGGAGSIDESIDWAHFKELDIIRSSSSSDEIEEIRKEIKEKEHLVR
jgi:hypothetical protein